MNVFRSKPVALIARNFWNLIRGGPRVSPASKQCIEGLDAAINPLEESVDAVIKSRSKSPPAPT
jgi:hypothetical protein